MLPWNDIDSVFLDMDGTLLDLHFDNHFWREHVPLRYAEKHNMDLEQARDELVPRFRSKEGSLEWYCVEYWSRELDLDITALKREVGHLVSLHDHSSEFLERSRAAGKRIVLLTNAHRHTLELKMELTGLQGAFDRLLCSHELGYPKEDLRFWSALCSQESFSSDRTLFVDDSLPVLRTARAFGIAHIIAIRKPDSRLPARDVDEFIAIDGFDQIMPARRAGRSRP